MSATPRSGVPLGPCAGSLRPRTAASNAMKEGLPRGGRLRRVTTRASRRRPVDMLHAGLDLSRRRLDYCLLRGDGVVVETGAVAPDRDGLCGLARLVALRHARQPVAAVIESMNGARFVHDTL